MKKTALLIDGGWFSKGLGKILKLPNGWPKAAQVVKNAQAVLQADEELFRIFYYDCEPFGREVTNPVDGSKKDYKLMPAYAARKQFFFDLGQTGFVALRRGELKARGWEFSATYRQGLIAGGAPIAPTATDVYPNFEQKGVDMRIGIDVATLSLKKIVERIILFSGDTDMIPALKLARREGLQVFVVKLDPWPLKHNIIEDSDGVRVLIPRL
jgi:NYN domain